MSIALELVCCRYPDQDKDPVTSDSLVTTLSLLAPVIFSFCTPPLPFLSPSPVLAMVTSAGELQDIDPCLTVSGLPNYLLV